MLQNIYKNAITESKKNPLEDKLFYALPALLNNPMRPKKKINPHIEAILMHMNVLKCMNTFSQYTWADKPIIENGILQPAFPCRRVETASLAIIKLYDEVGNSLIKSKLRKIREREIELNLREIRIKPLRTEHESEYYETMLNLFKQTPESSAIVKTTCGHIYGSIRNMNAGALN